MGVWGDGGMIRLVVGVAGVLAMQKCLLDLCPSGKSMDEIKKVLLLVLGCAVQVGGVFGVMGKGTTLQGPALMNRELGTTWEVGGSWRSCPS